MSDLGTKILLLGASGQLGQAFVELSKTEAFPIGWILTPLGRSELDYSHSEAVESRVRLEKPDLILNCAAYTAVDRAESERDLAEQVNGRIPCLLAQIARDLSIPLIHYSSDYVYAGSGEGPHLETELIAPLNHYGRSKAIGDEGIQAAGCDHLIFRTSWVYSHTGNNFVKTMLRVSKERSELRIVNDQFGAPTYAPDLAKYSLQALMRALEMKATGKAFPSGVYHLANAGAVSWAGFAGVILPGKSIVGISSSEYPTPAKRPLNSRLDLNKFQTTFGIQPRSWESALGDCLQSLRLRENEGLHG
jgi:dTDP-4-dehydrorhamnose reductase